MLAGLARAELWPEVRERAWTSVLDAARDARPLVIVDLASPIEEDEELAFDRVPYRRNLMTVGALAAADEILLVVAGDPVGIRRGIVAHRTLAEANPAAARKVSVVVNRAPQAARRVQDCSSQLSEWTGSPPIAFLPTRGVVRARGLGRSAAPGDRAAVAVAARAARSRRRADGMSTTEVPDRRAVEIVERDVRELLQRRELATHHDAELTLLVDEVVVDYRDRYLSGGLPVLTDEDVELLHHRIGGFGALTRLLEDPEVEEIWINEPGRVFAARRGEHELTTVVLSRSEVEELVERMLARAGRRLDRSQPFVDARLPDGSRLHVVIPPITDQWAINIRKFVGLRAESLDELVALELVLGRRRCGSSTSQFEPVCRLSWPGRSGPGRRPCSTASRRRFRHASGSSPVKKCSSCASLVPTSSRCSVANRTSKVKARSRCATSSGRASACARIGSSSARCAGPSASTCCSR